MRMTAVPASCSETTYVSKVPTVESVMLMTILPDSAHAVLTIPTSDLCIEAVEFPTRKRHQLMNPQL